MLNEIDAIYEHGILRPLRPLALGENELVRVTVSRSSDSDLFDTEYMDACAESADESITLEQVRLSLATIVGSMDEAINEDRGSR